MLAAEPTRSPHRLLQEELDGDLWLTLVACIFLNRTKRVVSEPIFRELTSLCPTVDAFLRAHEQDASRLLEMLRPMGFQNRRLARLEHLAQEISITELHDPDHVFAWGEIRGLHAVGPYAGDAARIFCCGSLPESEPDDGPLSAYWRWACENPNLYQKWLSERDGRRR